MTVVLCGALQGYFGNVTALHWVAGGGVNYAINDVRLVTIAISGKVTNPTVSNQTNWRNVAQISATDSDNHYLIQPRSDINGVGIDNLTSNGRLRLPGAK